MGQPFGMDQIEGFNSDVEKEEGVARRRQNGYALMA
jgi:hypothetical protein